MMKMLEENTSIITVTKSNYPELKVEIKKTDMSKKIVPS